MRETWDFSMPLEEAMTTQRAVRRLKPDPVDDALVLRLIELAVKAPSGSNAQNWEFIVVRDPDVKAKLARRNRQAWHLYGGLGRWLTRNDPKMSRVLDAVQWQADHFEEIPVLVVACLRGPRLWFPPIATASYYGVGLPRGAEPAARRARREPRRGADHAPAVEHLVGATHPRLPLERAALRGDPARLAARPLRPDDAPAGGRGGLARPLWAPALEGRSARARLVIRGARRR